MTPCDGTTEQDWVAETAHIFISGRRWGGHAAPVIRRISCRMLSPSVISRQSADAATLLASLPGGHGRRQPRRATRHRHLWGSIRSRQPSLARIRDPNRPDTKIAKTKYGGLRTVTSPVVLDPDGHGYEHGGLVRVMATASNGPTP